MMFVNVTADVEEMFTHIAEPRQPLLYSRFSDSEKITLGWSQGRQHD